MDTIYSEDLETEREYRIATVATVEADGLTLLFDGEEQASEKHYRANTTAQFAAGQRVVVQRISGSYVVMFPIGEPGKDAPKNYIPSGGSDGAALVKDGTKDYKLKWSTDLANHIPAGGTSGQMLIKDGATDFALKWSDVPKNYIPAGGSDGQLLAKNGTTAYALKWVSETNYIPAGGTDGQILAKNGATAYSLKWIAAPENHIPSGGTDGQMLVKNGATAYALKWVTAPTGIPTGGTDGQVLTKNGTTNYSVKWATLSPTVAKLTSGSNTLTLSTKTLTPSSSDFVMGTATYPIKHHAKSVILYYSSYKYCTLACDMNGKLTVNGTAIS